MFVTYDLDERTRGGGTATFPRSSESISLARSRTGLWEPFRKGLVGKSTV